MKMRLKNIPYFSTKQFKLPGLHGMFESCMWNGVTQLGGIDSVGTPDSRKMQVYCYSGALVGNKLWLDWDTEVDLHSSDG